MTICIACARERIREYGGGKGGGEGCGGGEGGGDGSGEGGQRVVAARPTALRETASLGEGSGGQ